jgi:uncharacterized membrane protein YraQ (UPF0718 family)
MYSTIVLYSVAAVALLVSLIADRQKTVRALKIAWNRLKNISLMMMVVVVLVAITLYFVSDALIAQVLGSENLLVSLGIGSLVGSVAIIPGFIVFPLCGLLLTKGVPYVVLAAFTTTLMMVGVVTFPMEKKLFGTRFALVRNLMSLVIALFVAFVIGVVFGEIPG